MAPDAFLKKDVLSRVSVRGDLGHITEPSSYGIINPLRHCQANQHINVFTHFSASCSFSPFSSRIHKIDAGIWSSRDLRG